MNIFESNHLCPVCGYGLDFAPWIEGSAADEICPCCGIQFGYDDSVGDNLELQQAVYERWRNDWIQHGMQWFSKGRKPPIDWNPKCQMKELISQPVKPCG